MSEMKFAHLADAGLGDISATVSSLPIGYTLGQAREYNRVDYVLAFNAGNSVIPAGGVAGAASGGGYSVTVSTVGLGIGMDHIGAVVANHTSVPTANYFWGAKKGVIASGLIASAVCVPTGVAFYIGTNGNVVALPQSVVTGMHPAGVALTTILSTTSGGGRNGSAYINLA